MAVKMKELFQKETVFCASAVLAVISAILVPPSVEYLSYIDYKTLALLFCLMSVVAGLQSIGVFNRLGSFLLTKARDTRILGILLVMVCFFSSMLITNDVALITFVPFTILVYRMVGKEEKLIKVIVLETIAANLGSMATPVGNPQNLYLYSVSGISAAEFFAAVLPYAGLSFVLLLAVLLFDKNDKIEYCGQNNGTGGNDVEGNAVEGGRAAAAGAEIPRGRFSAYLILFAVCLLVVAHVLSWGAALAMVLCWMLAADRKLFAQADYFLLLTFVCFFIFIGNMKQMEGISLFLQKLIQGHELLTGIIASQVISNVPAAILLSGFTGEFQTLLTAVNLGGLGTLIASLASLISFKAYTKEYGNKKGAYFLQFTVWNAAFLAVLTADAVLLGA